MIRSIKLINNIDITSNNEDIKVLRWQNRPKNKYLLELLKRSKVG